MHRSTASTWPPGTGWVPPWPGATWSSTPAGAAVRRPHRTPAGCARDDGLRGLAEVGARRTAAGDRRSGDALAQAFEALRPRLVRVAYATVGSVAEAEDCVQEAWLRLRRVGDSAEIRDLGAWLTTTVSRLALDALGGPRRAGSVMSVPGCPSRVLSVISFTVDGGRIAAIDVVRNPDKLTGVREPG